MSKIIIYDNKNILIGKLEKTEKRSGKDKTEYVAVFSKFKIIHRISLNKQLKKIEKILKFHKEK